MDPKTYISLTEIARRLGIPKEIICRVIEDGGLNVFVIENGEIFFDQKYLGDVRYAAIGSTYHLHFLRTGETPPLSYNWGFNRENRAGDNRP